MTRSRYLFGIVRKRFFRSPPQETIIVFHTNNTSSSFTTTDDAARNSEAIKPEEKKPSNEEVAAIRIQAFFRGHLARRAFRALRGLVKLQAVVRGVCVRRQARIALHCMHALARLQITVRARQLLIG